jgi:hypothetical protein
MLACSMVALFGVLVTFLFVEDRRKFSMDGAAAVAPAPGAAAPAGETPEAPGWEENSEEDSSFVAPEARVRMGEGDSSPARPQPRVRAS